MATTTNEIDFVINARKDSLTPKTITNYTNYYKRLRALVPKEIKDMNEEDIITAIRNATDPKKDNAPIPVSVKQSLINIAIVIRQVYKKPVEELIQHRTIGKDDLREEIVEKNKGLKDTLPTVKELVDYTEQLYTDGKWAKYIVNYLMITFGVRNMDLNLTITRTDKSVNNKDNWLVLRANSVRYIRYIFKTADTYDCRENEIKSEKFVEACKQLLGDEASVPLLTTSDGERIKEANLNKYISRATKDELGQAKYFKVLLNKNKADIERLSANRGTNLQTLIQHYDIDFKNAEGEQKKKQAQQKLTSCKRIPAEEKGEAKKAKKKETKKGELEKAHAVIEAEEKAKADAEVKPKKQTRKKKLVVVE